MSEDSQEEIIVKDKRRFREDGSAKEADSSKEGGAPSKSEDRQQQESVAAERPKPEPASGPTQEHQVDFSSFVVSLATQALVMMGEMPHPESGQTIKQLDIAKQTIDMLGVLEDKTKGNLTSQEEKLLGDVLASVRLAFVRASK